MQPRVVDPATAPVGADGTTVRLMGPDGRVTVLDSVAAARAARESSGGTIWVDMVAPDPADLRAVTAALGPDVELHPLLVEDVFEHRRRAKIDRFDDHVFLDLIDVAVVEPAVVEPAVVEPAATGPAGAGAQGGTPGRGRRVELPGGQALVLGACSAVVYARDLLTVRSDARTLGVERIPGLWSAAEPARRQGVGLLVHALLDQVVDRIVAATELLDADVDELEQDVVTTGVRRSAVQGRAFALRQATALVRRVAVPTRELVGQVLRRDGTGFLARTITSEDVPYLHDVGDHVVRVAETLDALRDELTSVLELNMSMQDAELNQVMKKLSAWAAIIAVPTAITGYFGQNVPYPGYAQPWGFVVSIVAMLVGAVGLWWWFRRLRWL